VFSRADIVSSGGWLRLRPCRTGSVDRHRIEVDPNFALPLPTRSQPPPSYPTPTSESRGRSKKKKKRKENSLQQVPCSGTSVGHPNAPSGTDSFGCSRANIMHRLSDGKTTRRRRVCARARGAFLFSFSFVPPV
jgi:hypothetical protein